jgi:hypothetical protein
MIPANTIGKPLEDKAIDVVLQMNFCSNHNQNQAINRDSNVPHDLAVTLFFLHRWYNFQIFYTYYYNCKSERIKMGNKAAKCLLTDLNLRKMKRTETIKPKL